MGDQSSAGRDEQPAVGGSDVDALDELDRLREEAQTEDPARRARALARLAVGLQDKKRPAEALEAVEGARVAFCASGDSQGEVLCDRLAARLLLGLGRPLDASKRLAAARRRLLDGSSDPAELAACEQQLASALHQLGRLQDVVGLLVSARELYSKADLLRDAGMCDNDLGVLMARVGDPDRSLEHFEAARLCLTEPSRELAVVAFNEATVLWDAGRLEDAGKRLLEARAAFAAEDADVEVAWCEQNLGVLAVASGRLPEAVDHFVEAQDRYRTATAWTAVAWCDANLALVLDALGRREEARARRPPP